mgnify:CR=1 FL=1
MEFFDKLSETIVSAGKDVGQPRMCLRSQS